MGTKALALLALLLAGPALALDYQVQVVREHRVLLRLAGGNHWLACLSKNSVPHYYEECEIVTIKFPMTCILEPQGEGGIVADCRPKGL